jgi:hypothetical protein
MSTTVDMMGAGGGFGGWGMGNGEWGMGDGMVDCRFKLVSSSGPSFTSFLPSLLRGRNGGISVNFF